MASSSNPPQKIKEIKLPQCPICIEAYNLQKKLPYYICPNSHSICKECYREHKLINQNLYCPICKCDMNSIHRENNDILALLGLYEIFNQGKAHGSNQKSDLNHIRKLHQDLDFKQKFRIPQMIQIILLLTALCVFPLLFVLISQFSYIIIAFEKSTVLFVYEFVLSIISFIWHLVWTFLQGFHATCETLFIYRIIFHIIYVIHMIWIGFSFLFVLKLCAEKVVNEQWKVNGKNLKTIELPKNQIERHCFVVLVNFVNFTNRIFQIETHNK